MRPIVLLHALLAVVFPTVVNAADFEQRGQVLLFETKQEIAESLFNPGNALAQLPKSTAEVNVRLDMSTRLDACMAVLKPRFDGVHEIDNDPGHQGMAGGDAYFNTATLRCSLPGKLSVSVGRESIQWGNGTFRSPSNPFFTDTGKTNPLREIEGRDFTQLTWSPLGNLGITWLHNYGLSRRDNPTLPFRTINALKVDWVGADVSAGALLSRRRGDSPRLNSYFTHTLSDAWIWYGEGNIGKGSPGLYPQAGGPFGWTFQESNDNSLRYEALLGVQYSFENGDTFSVEALRNNTGYSQGQADAALDAVKAAGPVFLSGGPLTGFAAQTLAFALDPGLRELRRRYVFLQWLRAETGKSVDFAVRYIHSFDDNAGQWSLSLAHNLNRNTQLFLFGVLATGGSESEFGRLLRYSANAGVRFYF